MVFACGTCQGLQRHPRVVELSQETEEETLQLVNATLSGLRASSHNCRACALLLDGILLHHERFAGIDEASIRVRAESFPPGLGQSLQDHLSIELRWNEQEDDFGDDQSEDVGSPDLKLEFFTDQDGQSSFTAIGRGRSISENPLQDPGLSTAQDLVRTCLSEHSKCRSQRPTTLPKRILDVLPGPDVSSIVLHETESSNSKQSYEEGEYVALSHVWGTSTGPRTTAANLESQKKGIALSTLPRTFQEAVLLTRALGVRYLWIDALCLIQDDEQAKLEESIRMDDVFGNASLTIAATSAPDNTHPLFTAKTPPFKIQATDNQGCDSTVYVREQPLHYSFKAPFDEGSHMNDWELPFNISDEANVHTPLLKRAWAYVERLLSPRVLHFTSSEMILECREAYSCECGRIDDPMFDSRTTDSIKQEYSRIVYEAAQRPPPNSTGSKTPTTQTVDGVTIQLAGSTITSSTEDLHERRNEAIHLWSYIITEFTARNMTYDERLTAIASIAKTLVPAMQSGYIAGQWTFSTLSLLWYPHDNTQTRRPVPMDGQTIPTWSWASCEGSPISFDNTSAMDLACRASFGPKGKRATAWSPIQGEPMNISAAMVVDVVVHVSGDKYSLARNDISVEFSPDVLVPQGDDALEDGGSLVCVLVSMTYRSSILGLVLRSAGTNLWRRVGRLECYDCGPEDGKDGMREDAEALFGHWFPSIRDMTKLDDLTQRHFSVI